MAAVLLGACTKDENKGNCKNCKTSIVTDRNTLKIIKDTTICNVDQSILEWYIRDNSSNNGVYVAGYTYAPGYTFTECK